MSERETAGMKALIEHTPFRKGLGKHRDYASLAPVLDIPDTFLDSSAKEKLLKSENSTQTVFGQVMLSIAKHKGAFADRVMTMAPDVATSTNLSGFVSVRGTFELNEALDSSKRLGVMSAMKWDRTHAGKTNHLS